MKDSYSPSDIIVSVDENTDCRIGIGKKYGGGGTERMQIRYIHGESKDIPFFSLLAPYCEWSRNIVFTHESEFLAKSISFSNKEIFDLFCRSPNTPHFPLLQQILKNTSDIQKFIPEVDSNGALTSWLVDQHIVHEEGIEHIATYFFAINRHVFKEQGDIGIYLPRKTQLGYKEKTPCPGSLGGGDILVSTHPYLIDTGDTSSEALSEWKTRAQSRIHSGLRRYLSVYSILRKIQDEVGIILGWAEIFPKISELWQLSIHSLIPEVPALSCIEYNFPYTYNDEIQGMSQNERLDIYAFEYTWEIAQFNQEKIESIELLPSKRVLEILENDSGFFGEESDENWKTSPQYLIIKRVVERVRGLLKS